MRERLSVAVMARMKRSYLQAVMWDRASNLRVRSGLMDGEVVCCDERD
jgi:hypothetical protein